MSIFYMFPNGYLHIGRPARKVLKRIFLTVLLCTVSCGFFFFPVTGFSAPADKEPENSQDDKVVIPSLNMMPILMMVLNENQPPDGIIDNPASDIQTCLGCPVEFTATGIDPDQDPLTYHWNFGGSGLPDSYVEDPGFLTFQTPGTYTVTLEVTDSKGLSDPSPATVRVTVLDNRAPESVIDQPAADVLIPPGGQVEFAGHGSDPDGDLSLSYHWDFGDPTIPDSTAEDPGSVTYDTPGIYVVTFTVKDDRGQEDPTPAEVTVQVNFPPESLIDSPDDGDVINPGEQFCFAGTGADPDGHLPLSYLWDFGSSGFPHSEDEDPGCYTYNNSGSYSISLTVTDAQGFSDPTPATVSVRVNSAPEGNITSPASNLTINPGDTVSFAGSATDSDNDTPLSYLWNFGDPALDDSTLQNPSQTFPNLGRFPVTYTVTDALGLADPTPSRIYIQVGGDVFPRIIDNLDQECTIPAGWGYEDSSSGCDYYETNYSLGSRGNSDVSASWVFQPNQYGNYELQIWWPSNGSCYNEGGSSWFSWEAPYTVSNNGVVRDHYRLNHRRDGGTFVTVGTYLLVPGTFTVQLANISSGIVRADAVQLVYQNEGALVQIVSPRDNDLVTSTSPTVVAYRGNLSTDDTVQFILDGDTANPLSGSDCHQGYLCLSLNGLSRSEHTIKVEVRDVGGVLKAEDQISFGIGDYYVLVGDSITAGYGDDLLTDNTSADGRNTTGGWVPFFNPPRIVGGYGSMLNDALTASQGHPYTMIDEGVGGATSQDGASRIHSLLNLHPDATHFLVMYGTNDAALGLRRPSGAGTNPGDPDYSGSYKDYMQQIISAIQNAGKQVFLAKVPVSLGEDPEGARFADPDTAEKNNLIKEYNQVVDELVSANGITVSPPDLYTYFLNNQDQFYDNLHPNGYGYQGIAQLWHNAINP